MEDPRLGTESELLAYATAIAVSDVSCICDLYRSLQQGQILNPLSGARDRTHVLVDTSQVCYCCATMGIPVCWFLIKHVRIERNLESSFNRSQTV